MNAQQVQITDWIIGTFGTDARTAAIVACSYDSSELEDMDSIKSELMSWKNTDDLLIELGVFKKLWNMIPENNEGTCFGVVIR